jgi:uncharacterized integral membrane protein
VRTRTILTLIFLVLITGLVVVNWGVFAAPVRVSLIVTTLEVPVGVVTLALCALTLLVFLGYASLWQGTLLMEFRRQARELQAQRTLAESAEGSRFTELAGLVREEFAKSDRRLEAALEALRREFKDSENSIAATLGEMDDRLARDLNARGITPRDAADGGAAARNATQRP